MHRRNTVKRDQKNMPGKFPAITPENFPVLVEVDISKPAEWNYEEKPVKNNAKIYSNGDVFEGQYDETTGKPDFGKITFKNGDVYEGPILYCWPHQRPPIYVEVELEDGEIEEQPMEQEAEYYDYGTFTDADGKKTVGVFCFGKEW